MKTQVRLPLRLANIRVCLDVAGCVCVMGTPVHSSINQWQLNTGYRNQQSHPFDPGHVLQELIHFR